MDKEGDTGLGVVITEERTAALAVVLAVALLATTADVVLEFEAMIDVTEKIAEA